MAHGNVPPRELFLHPRRPSRLSRPKYQRRQRQLRAPTASLVLQPNPLAVWPTVITATARDLPKGTRVPRLVLPSQVSHPLPNPPIASGVSFRFDAQG
jgi:hypothetical protein